MKGRLRLSRLPWIVNARLRWAYGRMLHRREVRAGRSLPVDPAHAPVFIIGAPRSGTTLAYQLLVAGLDVGWLANAHAARPNDIVKVERSAPPCSQRIADLQFESEHGATRGAWGPSEAGEYWYRFFPRDRHQQGEADATPERTTAIAAAMRAFAAACDSVVVSKNTLNTLRIPVLAAALPEARFVLVERDRADNARSLLVGRVRRGDVDAWWSARPDGADRLIASGADPATQVVWQVDELARIAQSDLQAHAPGRWTTISYDDLCDDPTGVVTHVREWLGAAGITVKPRDGVAVPTRFDKRGGGALEAGLEAQLEAALDATREDDQA